MHTIRLGPPWVVTPSADGTGTRHARKFGRPRALAPAERLWIVCSHVPAAAEVTLNGAPLGAPAAGPFAADITESAQLRNEVVIEVASAEPLGPVALEIRAAEV